MYLDRAMDEDKKMAEGWKDDAEGLLVFVGLRATSHSFAHNLESVEWFILGCRCSIARSDPPRYSAEFAGRVSLLLGTNLSATGFPIEWVKNFHPIEFDRSLPAIHPPCPAAAVWVNGLWSLSLVISLTCALMATLLQHWARRYLIIAHPVYRPRKRARIRAFYTQGVRNLPLPWTAGPLLTLLHISLFFFLAGLSVFLFGVNHTIFNVVIAWVGLGVVVYTYLTFLPITYKNSPYSTPLSMLVSFCLTGMRNFLFNLYIRLHPDNFSSNSYRAGHAPFFHTLCVRPQRNAPLNWGLVLTMPRCCGRSSYWMEIKDSKNSLQAFLPSVAQTVTPRSKASSDQTTGSYQVP
jgi:hypothetical protein